MDITTVIGIDAHSRQHSAAAVDTHGRPQQLLAVGAAQAELDRLVAWIQQQPKRSSTLPRT
jgi:hypothetical protein